MTNVQSERIRLVGQKLEDVREHLTVVKSEVAIIEERFELVLNELAELVREGGGGGR